MASTDQGSTLTFQDFIRLVDTQKVLEFSPQTLQDMIDSLVTVVVQPIPTEPEIVVQEEETVPEGSGVGFWLEKFNADTIKHLIAGGVAGAVSRTAVSPMERMKILFQVQGPEPAAYQGIVPTLTKMWKEEGMMGFLRGNGTNVVRIIPYSATQFAAYEQFKTMLMEPGKTELDTARRLTAGALAGLVSVACTYPLDIVRTRLAVQSATLSGNTSTANAKLPGILPTMRQIYHNEGGIFGLYRGLWPTLLGVAPYVALNFQCYEVLKMHLLPSDREGPTVARKLVCGALAGSIAQTVTYPLDVLRRRMQVTGMASMHYKYRGTWDATKTMVQKEGFRGLYKGMIPNYLKVAPAISISFVTFNVWNSVQSNWGPPIHSSAMILELTDNQLVLTNLENMQVMVITQQRFQFTFHTLKACQEVFYAIKDVIPCHVLADATSSVCSNALSLRR
ncbi:hypothetical protein INT44_002758 [Umbelopsis vinacea]|uniref:Uncharacterized protein n=1 Tax=Umbelopsis vinacea TaxID=44442 RepID=A0A8H7UPS3_9FUNG|nr:hypothetical protein INT44_002758 [Umbelopsis vinacea]